MDAPPPPAQRVSAAAVVTTAWFWLLFGLTAPVFFALAGVAFLATAPFDPERRVLHALICRWTFQYLRMAPGWSARVEGRERIPAGPCVLVANHQSMADVVAALGLFRRFKFVSKASLFSLPIVGWLMTMARYVRLERGRTGSTRSMMIESRRWLRRGVPVLMFPEGTYAPGPELLPFKRGAFALAVEEGVPVVPVRIDGTAELIRGDGPWLNPRARIRVEVREPIAPSEVGSDVAALSAKVRESLARPWDRSSATGSSGRAARR